jgi:RNA polymerase sigma-70 factor, ECF subfamily
LSVSLFVCNSLNCLIIFLIPVRFSRILGTNRKDITVTETAQRDIFETWLKLHKGLLFKVVRAYAFTRADQDDLFQEIAIQVWNSIPVFRQESAVTTWLYRISLNTAIKWVKRETKHSRVQSIDDVPAILFERVPHVDDRLVWLYEEIYKLNAVDRSIALLLLDNFSYKEMAVILGITESNVGVKINRIKKHLIAKSKLYDHHGI